MLISTIIGSVKIYNSTFDNVLAKVYGSILYMAGNAYKATLELNDISC